MVAAFGFIAHIRARGEEAQATKAKSGQKARRWVVERTHSWMNHFRSFDPLGQQTRELPGHASLRLRLDRLPCRRIIRIGS